jgi:hypothetical protein
MNSTPASRIAGFTQHPLRAPHCFLLTHVGFHDLRNDFILLRQLRFQLLDPLLHSPPLARRLFLKGRRAPFKKTLLPTIKNIRVQTLLVTQIRDCYSLQ